MANKKAEILTMDGQVVSPITLATNVLLEDGRTAQDLLDSRDESMFSPTITTSSSISKVGQGDNVDYSENVVNGAYESCVLKGNTKVNLIQEPSSQDIVLPYEFEDGQYVTINDTKESGALGIELKGQTFVNISNRNANSITLNSSNPTVYLNNRFVLTTGKKYIIIGNVSDIDAPSKGLCLWLVSTGGTNYYDSNLTKTTGRFVKIITVSEEIMSARLYIHGDDRDNGGSITLDSLMLLEYQEGMENWDIPYFEGMQSVQAPSVTTVGKNLFDGELDTNYYKYDGTNLFNSSILGTNSNVLRNANPIKVKSNTNYSFSVDSDIATRFTFFDSKGEFIKTVEPSSKNSVSSFMSPQNAKYFVFNTTTATSLDIVKNANFQIEESTTPTTYEPHKSTTLTTPEEITLRGIGNVKDTLNTVTGEYMQRIGEIVLDGSEDEEWWIDTGGSKGYTRFALKRGDRPSPISNVHLNKFICDKIKTVSVISGDVSTEVCLVETYTNYLVSIVISNEKLGAVLVDNFKQYLSQNPITVQYQLATPITKKLSLTFTDQDNAPTTKLSAYDTTTHINASSQEGSLIPTLSHVNPTYPVILKPSTKYSIVANSYSNDHTNSPINFNLGGATVSTTVGNRVSTVTTPSTLTSEKLVMSGRGNKLNNVMVIEGDVVGDEPYFEGMCDVEMPVVTNVGKNLFDKSDVTLGSYLAESLGKETLVGSTETFYQNSYVKLRKNTNYIINPQTKPIRLHFYNDKKEYQTRITNITTNQTTFNSQDYSFARLSCGIADLDNIQLEEFPTPTTYEPYKSNILSCNSEVVLRSLPNGVCDTLDLMTGEYVQRIGEVVLDGSEDEGWKQYTATNGNIYYYTNNYKNVASMYNFGRKLAICDRLKTPNSNTPSSSTNKYSLAPSNNDNQSQLQFSLNHTESLTEAKQWLSQNPITVQYQLATPIITTIDLKQHPFAYKDGCVVLASSSEEISLTPTIEYSLITNRLGQIQTNQKLVEKQQAQIDELESMVITNLVNTQYQQALNEIKLGVK